MLEYDKLVLESPAQRVRGFALGWGAARGLEPQEVGRRVVWPEEWDIRVGKALDGLIEAVRPGPVCCVLVETELASELLAAMQPWPDELRLRSRQRVRGAAFDFRYEVFARDEAAAIRSIFTQLPDGVQVSPDFAPEEHSDPSAAGVEAYAPAHAFDSRAHGTVSGALRCVLEVRTRCQQHERIRTGPVQLELD